ncbi:hypothetical protein K2173_000195 [Erythroxylum novogranatense]|uniref:Uncharacterized protein n=1 Tax=Erythroxylum novogranatense TaxID=1862640 RepID=A0AAV8SNU4_9ROSI|nr:hypothetical protein K2173_000195 [Erythroxylum novogranatense]
MLVSLMALSFQISFFYEIKRGCIFFYPKFCLKFPFFLIISWGIVFTEFKQNSSWTCIFCSESIHLIDPLRVEDGNRDSDGFPSWTSNEEEEGWRDIAE